MSNEYIEAFNRIALHTEYDNDSPYDCLCFEDDCKLVDDALERLDFIEGTKPNEALEYLKELEENKSFCSEFDLIKIDIIRDYILKAQENEKALEIIFKKKVMIEAIITLNLHDYNDLVSTDEQLTQEESDIVKRYYNEKNL
jgi:hypothetical protein